MFMSTDRSDKKPVLRKKLFGDAHKAGEELSDALDATEKSCAELMESLGRMTAARKRATSEQRTDEDKTAPSTPVKPKFNH
jgi:hypothetical protein